MVLFVLVLVLAWYWLVFKLKIVHFLSDLMTQLRCNGQVSSDYECM